MKLQPINSGFLEELDGHKVHYAQYGNVDGESIIVLHGGPGDKSKPKHFSRYDLSKYNVIAYDQRGCGESTPLGKIDHNTTSDLVNDIERIREKLGIKSWYVAGGSWGSTLALVYAESFPTIVKGLLLSAVSLARPRDIEWQYTKKDQVDRIFPDLWDRQNEFLQKFHTTQSGAAKDLLALIESSDEDTVREIVAGVMHWEGNLMTSQSDLTFIDPSDVTEEDIASVKIFLSYEVNNFYLTSNQIIDNIGTIKNIPTVIVHGRYDLLCPVENAWDLQKHLNNVETIILPSSNHRFTAEGDIVKKYAFNYFLEKQKTTKELGV